MIEDNDTRKQIEDDLNEDLELTGEDADAVRGGDGTTPAPAPPIPGRLKWSDVKLK